MPDSMSTVKSFDVPATSRFAPIFTFFFTPTPPSTCIAPVVLVVASVRSVAVRVVTDAATGVSEVFGLEALFFGREHHNFACLYQ